MELVEGIRQSMTPLFSLTSELDSFEAKLRLFCGELGISRTAGQEPRFQEGHRLVSTTCHSRDRGGARC